MTILNEEITFSLFCIAVTLAVLLTAKKFSRMHQTIEIYSKGQKDSATPKEKKERMIEAFEEAASIIDEIQDEIIQPIDESVFSRLHGHEKRIMRECIETPPIAESLENGAIKSKKMIEETLTKVKDIESPDLETFASNFGNLVRAVEAVEELTSHFKQIVESISRTKTEIEIIDQDLTKVIDGMNIQWRQ
tara:strand:- start:265 stop:837 length:573 start_codon:yes stop_codon:yes gene_type:complete